jgi:hypothetical protein
MKHAWLMLSAALILGAAVFGGSFFVGQRICCRTTASSTDDLDWLRQEFQISDTELAKIRELHEGYLPRCAEMCKQIATKQRELTDALAGATNLNATAQTKLTELHVLRAQCQGQMLEHFMSVSRAMQPAQGRRYLDEMQRLTLGAHDQIEQSMSDAASHAHGHE